MNDPQSDSSRENDGLHIEKIKRRDVSAIDVLYDRYAVIVYSILMRMLRSVDDAEDVLQDVFTHLWNNPDQYDIKSGSLLIPLTARTRNRGLARIRSRGAKKQNLQQGAPIPPLYSDSASLNELPGLESHASPAQALDALRKLSEDEQRMLSLSYYDGYSLWDISRRLNLPVGTVSWALWKCLADLRKSLGIEAEPASSHEKKLLESCTAHVLDILDAQETIEFNKHFASGCAVCRKEIARLKEIAALIPLGLPHISLSTELKQRVLFAARLSKVVKETASETEETERPEENPEAVRVLVTPENLHRRNPMLIFLTLLLSAALTVSVVYIVYLQKKLVRQTRPVDQQQLVERLSEAVEDKNNVLEILASKNLNIIQFTPYQNDREAHGKLFWDMEDTTAVIQIARLPTTPENQRYQLWAFVKGTYYLCGTFSIRRQLDPDNFFTVRMPQNLQSARPINFFIILGNSGNSDAPRGTRYLSGSLAETD